MKKLEKPTNEELIEQAIKSRRSEYIGALFGIISLFLTPINIIFGVLSILLFITISVHKLNEHSCKIRLEIRER